MARLGPVNILFGSDALMLLHRSMGIAGVVLLDAHVALLPVHSTERLGLGGSLALRAGALAAWALLALVALSVTRHRMGVRYERWLCGQRALATILLPDMLEPPSAGGRARRTPAWAGQSNRTQDYSLASRSTTGCVDRCASSDGRGE